MKGVRELNAMKDTPSFKIKKVLALSKLRHSTVGRKPGNSKRTFSKTTAVKKGIKSTTQTLPGDQTATLPTAVVNRKGRRPKLKWNRDAQPGLLAEENQSATEKADDSNSSTPIETKESKEINTTKAVVKRKSFKVVPIPVRKLRSNIDEMLMRHGKKVSKGVKPKRKRTLSSDFELLDEKSLKKQLKESNESGAETDQTESDASALAEPEETSEPSAGKKKGSGSVSLKAYNRPKESLRLSVLKVNEIGVDSDSDTSSHLDGEERSRKRKKDKSQSAVTKSLGKDIEMTPGDETDSASKTRKSRSQPLSPLVQDLGASFMATGSTNLKSMQKQVESRRSVGKSPTDETKQLSDDNTILKDGKKVSEPAFRAHAEFQPRRRGRPPKRKVAPLETDDIEQETNKSLLKDTQSMGGNVLAAKRARHETEGEVGSDPYSFSGVDCEEEDDTEISFKPPGICGEVKRKPGRPKLGASKQPAVRSLKVKSTHKELIFDQKSRPFSRVRGGRILKASQLYRGGKRKQKLGSSSLMSVKKSSAEVEKGLEKLIVDKESPTERPSGLSSLTLGIEVKVPEDTPYSPDSEHPVLPIMKELVSPAPSNEDLEPPVLELANIDSQTVTEEFEGVSVTLPDLNHKDTSSHSTGDLSENKENAVQEDEVPVDHVDDHVDHECVTVAIEKDSSPEEKDVQADQPPLDSQCDKDLVLSKIESNCAEKKPLFCLADAKELLSKMGKDVMFNNSQQDFDPGVSEDSLKTVEEQIIKDDTSGDVEMEEAIIHDSSLDLKLDISDATEGDHDFVKGDHDLEKGDHSVVSTVDTSTPESEVMEKLLDDVAEIIDIENEDKHAVEFCLESVLTRVEEMVKTDSELASQEEDKGSIIDTVSSSDNEVKEKEQKSDSGGIKMKLKRHKGKFKVTGLSEEDDSLLSNVVRGVDPDSDEDTFVKEKDLTPYEVVKSVLERILDHVEAMVDKKVLNKPEDTDFETSGEVADGSFSSSSEVSPDSEKRVPPLTIKLKTGKRPVRKFELRPKVTRSPMEIIAMRQKKIDQEYDKTEATRLARKIEKQIGKKKIQEKLTTKETNIAEVGLSNAQKVGNVDDLMSLCSPCTVNLVDFVKQLNLMNHPEVAEDSFVDKTNDTEIPQTSVSEPKVIGKSGRKSQFKSGRPRGKPPRPKCKQTPLTKNVSQAPAIVPTVDFHGVEKNVDELKESGYVGSYVEFLKAKKNEKPKTIPMKGIGPVKAVRNEATFDKEPKSGDKSTSVMETIPNTTVPSPITETSRAKHLSGDKRAGVRYVCNKCEFSSAVQKTVEFHVYSHIPDLTFKCGYCNRDFASMIGASTHSKNEHHGKEPKIIKSKDLNESDLYRTVEEAPKTTSDVSLVKGLGGGSAATPVIISFLIEKNIHLGSPSAKRFVCTHCDYSTDVLEDVQQHCKDLHAGDTMFACILCANAYFNSEETVKSHNQSTHPSRPQSYRRLPDFYDIEQIKAADKSQLEDRGNIFDRMNNLFSASGITDEGNAENLKLARYQQAKYFLTVQEGWKNKTSAEADSTTTVENEAEMEIVDSDNGTKTVTKEIDDTLIQKDKDMNAVKYSMDEGKTEEEVETASAIDGDDEPNYTPEKSVEMVTEEAETKGETKSLDTQETTSTGENGETLPSTEKTSSTQEKPVLDQQCVEDNASDPNDESGICNLKIVDVVSLRDQNSDLAPPSSPKKVSPRAASQVSRSAKNLPEVDVDALVMRNQKITCTYKCIKCDIHSPYLSAMVEHLKHYHSEVPLFTCPYCKTIKAPKPEFTTEINVHEHVKRVHPSNAAKNEVSLSDTAKTFVQVLAIPSGVECNKVGNTFVIEKDIYMCLKCKAHMPSLDYTFGHLEREHPSIFVHVCPICKTFKDKSEEVLFCHIMKEHKRDPNDHPLSVAMEDNLFVRIPSISKSGVYNDKVNPLKLPKTKSSYTSADNEDDVLVVGESKTVASTSNVMPTPVRRGRPPLISQGAGSVITGPQSGAKPYSSVKTNLQLRAPGAVHGRYSSPKSVSSVIKSSSESSQALMMDCESVDDPVNKITDVVEEDGDVEIPSTPITTSPINPASVSVSNVISHSAAVAVASSIVSDSIAKSSAARLKSFPVIAPKQQQVATAAAAPPPPPPPPLKRFGLSNQGVQNVQDLNVPNRLPNLPSVSQSSSVSGSTSSGLVGKAAPVKIAKAKSFSMTDKINKLHARAAEREREKARQAQGTNSSNSDSVSPLIPKDSPLINSSSNRLVNNSQTGQIPSRPVLKVPSYSSKFNLQKRPPNSSPQHPVSVPPVPLPNQIQASAGAYNKSLLFKNTPLDLSRTPSPATSPAVARTQQVIPVVSSSLQTPTPQPQQHTQSNSDDLPPDAFKIFNLKPNRKPTPPAPVSSAAGSPSPALLGNAIPSIVGTLAAPGTLLQQVQALPYAQLAQMQLAGVPLNPLQLQGLCLQGVNTNGSFVVANLPQQNTRPALSQSQVPLLHAPTATVTSQPRPGVSLSQSQRLPSSKTVAQALAERLHTSRAPVPVLQRPRTPFGPRTALRPPQMPVNNIGLLRSQKNFYCPHCPQFRQLQDFEVKPHIERCHPGKDVLFFEVSPVYNNC